MEKVLAKPINLFILNQLKLDLQPNPWFWRPK